MLNEVEHLRDPTRILRCAQDDVAWSLLTPSCPPSCPLSAVPSPPTSRRAYPLARATEMARRGPRLASRRCRGILAALGVTGAQGGLGTVTRHFVSSGPEGSPAVGSYVGKWSVIACLAPPRAVIAPRPFHHANT